MSTAPVAEELPRVGRGTELAQDGTALQTVTWAEAHGRLNRDGYCWLASVGPGGAPHVMPVLAVWSGSWIFVSSKDDSRKSRNLAVDGRCVVTSDTGDLRLVVEGTARRARDRSTLERASQTFESVYGWPTTVRGDRLDAEYGAPTSGGPPYGILEITPAKAFALPSEGTFLPTRWRF